MPDKKKLEVFKRTKMTLFRTCTLCKFGEVTTPSKATWGFCKHPEHFFTHARHGRMPGASHVAMGCEDFKIRNPNTREMTELGPYLELIPMHGTIVEEVGVEEIDEIEELLSPEQETIVDMHFKGSPEHVSKVVETALLVTQNEEFVEADTEPDEQREEPAPEPEPEPEPEESDEVDED